MRETIIKLLLIVITFAIVITACGDYGSKDGGDDDNSRHLYPPVDENVKVVEIHIIKEGDI